MPKKIISLDELSRFKNDYDNALETGQIIPSKSLVAQEIEPISPESGDTQETPFTLQGTGTANGTSSVDTGTVGKHIQKQGSVYCVNQFIDLDLTKLKALNTSGTWNDNVYTMRGVTFTVQSNKVVVNGTATGGNVAFILCNDTTNLGNRKFLIKGCPSGGSVSTYCIKWNMDFNEIDTGNGVVGTYSTKTFLFYMFEGTSLINKDLIPQGIDLTQWFNGNIPQDLLDHPEHWSLYQDYGNYIAYNTGTLVSGNGKYLVCGGRNVWDEEWELGNIDNNTGANSTTAGYIRSKNYCSCIPNKEYFGYTPSVLIRVFFYDKNYSFISNVVVPILSDSGTKIFKTPSNACYFRIKQYNTTYKNDITISLYYAGEDYSQYYPYEQPKVYDTGDEELLSTGVKLSVSGEREDIYDYKEPSGLITRRVGVVDLGTLSWNYDSDGSYFWSNPTGMAYPSSLSTVPNVTISKYVTYDFLTAANSSYSSFLTMSTNRLIIKDTSFGGNTTDFTNAMSGVMLYYELATPTEEQGTPFSENIEINDFGTMGWYSSYTDSNTNTLVSVPQGCKIFYPAWYVGFIDTLGQRADIDWNANNVVSQTELEVVDNKHDNLYAIMQENIGGTLRHQLADKANIDFANTAWIDLGTLAWNVYGVGGNTERAVSPLTGVKNPSSSSNVANIICPIEKTVSYNDIYVSYNNGAAIENGNIYIKHPDFIGKTGDQIKSMLNGILLAYEKA